MSHVPDLGEYGDAVLDREMLAYLRAAESGARRLRLQIEAKLAAAEPRLCAKCERPLTGRADRKFCSSRCRQAAYQRRRYVAAGFAGAALVMGAAAVQVPTVAHPVPTGPARYALDLAWRAPGGPEGPDRPEQDGGFWSPGATVLVSGGTAPTMARGRGTSFSVRLPDDLAALVGAWPGLAARMPSPEFRWLVSQSWEALRSTSED